MPGLEPIVWSSDFSVGVADLDQQHQRIVTVINRLIASTDSAPHSEIVSEVLGELTDYAHEHFEREETFLQEHGYPELDRQRREHRSFRKVTIDLCVDAMEKRPTVPMKLLSFLRDWWHRHILEDDLEYARRLGLIGP